MRAIASAARPVAACGGRDSSPNPSSVSAGASTVLSAVGATPTDSATSRRSMSTNRPDSGRFDQSALAVTWNSTTRPAPRVVCVTSGVPSASAAQVWLARSAEGSASTWRFDLHFVGDRQPGERRAGDELRDAGRLGPGQCPAKLAVAAQQLHRHQRIDLADRLLGGARAGEADQQPALLHHLVSASRSAPAGSGRVRQDQPQRPPAAAAS
ncbi:MAG: hypothetical protein WDN25_16655 [Acetobacteraceae bacterium]